MDLIPNRIQLEASTSRLRGLSDRSAPISASQMPDFSFFTARRYLLNKIQVNGRFLRFYRRLLSPSCITAKQEAVYGCKTDCMKRCCHIKQHRNLLGTFGPLSLSALRALQTRLPDAAGGSGGSLRACITGP
jgi:hypothetical protein